jgi:N-acetylglucosaminyldiphosphoundecaprenol N-acetyl-beta-D-mannosaminyltransferase
VSTLLASSSAETADSRELERISIANVAIDALTFDCVVERIVACAGSDDRGRYVVTPNAHHVALYQKDALFRTIYQNALLVVPDGVPLLWAARILGAGFPCRVNGTDLFETVCRRAAESNLRVYLLGGREGAALAAAERLLKRHPSLQVCGVDCPPFGFEHDAEREAQIVERINAAEPHVLFVGLGAPKQEYWMYANSTRLRVPISLGIGVSFELVGGLVTRAPRWMQVAGLEWFFRLIAEPQRLWKRYLVTNSIFCALVARQYFAGLKGRR